MGSDGHEEGMEGVDLGAGWEPGKGTGRNEVLKPNCYIVAGLFYFTQFGYVLVFLKAESGRMGSDGQQGGIEGVDLGCGLRRVGVGI